VGYKHAAKPLKSYSPINLKILCLYLTTFDIQKNFKETGKYVFISLFSQFLMIHEDPATCAHIDELSFVGVCNKINSDFFYLNGRSS